MADLAKAREKLNKRLSELDNRLHSIENELDAHQSKDWEELAVEREEDEVLEGMGHAGLAEIERIHAALSRIDKGTYGICVKCGDPVQKERLALLPATPFCAACAV